MNSMYLRYNICMILVVLTVFPNLYWAVRAPWKPRDPEKPKPPRTFNPILLTVTVEKVKDAATRKPCKCSGKQQ